MKKSIIAAIATAACAAMLLAGCTGSGSLLAMDMAEDGSSCAITFDNATEDDFTSAGTLTVGEGETIIVDQAIEEGGSATVAVIPADTESMDDISADTEELTDALSVENAALLIPLEGEGQFYYEIMPGDYYLSVTVESKTTGTADISVGPAEATAE